MLVARSSLTSRQGGMSGAYNFNDDLKRDAVVQITEPAAGQNQLQLIGKDDGLGFGTCIPAGFGLFLMRQSRDGGLVRR